jgi:hypothetical protein
MRDMSALVGRLIAAAIFVGCVAVFWFAYSERHLETWERTLQAVGLKETPAEHLNAINQPPGYTQRGRTETGAQAGGGEEG